MSAPTRPYLSYPPLQKPMLSCLPHLPSDPVPYPDMHYPAPGLLERRKATLVPLLISEASPQKDSHLSQSEDSHLSQSKDSPTDPICTDQKKTIIPNQWQNYSEWMDGLDGLCQQSIIKRSSNQWFEPSYLSNSKVWVSTETLNDEDLVAMNNIEDEEQVTQQMLQKVNGLMEEISERNYPSKLFEFPFASLTTEFRCKTVVDIIIEKVVASSEFNIGLVYLCAGLSAKAPVDVDKEDGSIEQMVFKSLIVEKCEQEFSTYVFVISEGVEEREEEVKVVKSESLEKASDTTVHKDLRRSNTIRLIGELYVLDIFDKKDIIWMIERLNFRADPDSCQSLKELLQLVMFKLHREADSKEVVTLNRGLNRTRLLSDCNRELNAIWVRTRRERKLAAAGGPPDPLRLQEALQMLSNAASRAQTPTIGSATNGSGPSVRPRFRGIRSSAQSLVSSTSLSSISQCSSTQRPSSLRSSSQSSSSQRSSSHSSDSVFVQNTGLPNTSRQSLRGVQRHNMHRLGLPLPQSPLRHLPNTLPSNPTDKQMEQTMNHIRQKLDQIHTAQNPVPSTDL